MRSLSWYKHPSSVLLVDDQPAFLQAMKKHFPSSLSYHIHSKPKQLLEKLQSHFRDQPIQSLYQLNQQDDLLGKFTWHFDVSKVYKKLYDPNRLEEISLLIVDYAMPSLNGVEFCRQLKNAPCKKIMLTGEADLEIAVAAFNEGIVDRFILKKDPQVIQLLKSSISELTDQYFFEKTQELRLAMGKNNQYSGNDTDIQKLVKPHLSPSNVKEYYLLDINGSYLFVDKQDNLNAIIIKTQQNLHDYYHIAKDNEGSEKLLKSLEKMEQMPLLMTAEDYQRPISQWQNRLVPIQRIAPDKEIYYAKINNLEMIG